MKKSASNIWLFQIKAVILQSTSVSMSYNRRNGRQKEGLVA